MTDDPHGIRRMREARGWNERELARRAGVPYQRVQYLEKLTPHGEPPTSKYLPRILAALQDGLPAPSTKPTRPLNLGDALPVYALRINASSGGIEMPGLVIDTVSRTDNVSLISDAYALQMRLADMEPMYRPSDVLIVNPIGIAQKETGVVLSQNDHHDVQIGEFVADRPDVWVIRKYGAEPRDVELKKADYPLCHTVAAVLPGR